MRRVVLAALLAVLGLTLTITGGLAARSATVAREASLEQGILRDVNRLRSTRGLHVLSLSSGLEAAAAFQSRVMVSQGFFNHDSPGASFRARLRRFYPDRGFGTWAVGENLLWGADGIGSGDAVQAWLKSPDHRKILLDPSWREVGVSAVSVTTPTGVYATADGPVVVVTMDFGARSDTARATSSTRR